MFKFQIFFGFFDLKALSEENCNLQVKLKYSESARGLNIQMSNYFISFGEFLLYFWEIHHSLLIVNDFDQLQSPPSVHLWLHNRDLHLPRASNPFPCSYLFTDMFMTLLYIYKNVYVIAFITTSTFMAFFILTITFMSLLYNYKHIYGIVLNLQACLRHYFIFTITFMALLYIYLQRGPNQQSHWCRCGVCYYSLSLYPDANHHHNLKMITIANKLSAQ